jgi:hypothetical protein
LNVCFALTHLPNTRLNPCFDRRAGARVNVERVFCVPAFRNTGLECVFRVRAFRNTGLECVFRVRTFREPRLECVFRIRAALRRQSDSLFRPRATLRRESDCCFPGGEGSGVDDGCLFGADVALGEELVSLSRRHQGSASKARLRAANATRAGEARKRCSRNWASA